MRRLFLITAALAAICAGTPALAHPHHRGHYHRYERVSGRQDRSGSRFGSWGRPTYQGGWFGSPWHSYGPEQRGYQGGYRSHRGDPRPAQWCAWWLRQKLGIAIGAINNTALSFLHYGHNTSPHTGVVVVWSHGHGHGHVGQITGGKCGPSSWIVTSGNDGHAVRTRCRFVGNAVGFREG